MGQLFLMSDFFVRPTVWKPDECLGPLDQQGPAQTKVVRCQWQGETHFHPLHMFPLPLLYANIVEDVFRNLINPVHDYIHYPVKNSHTLKNLFKVGKIIKIYFRWHLWENIQLRKMIMYIYLVIFHRSNWWRISSSFQLAGDGIPSGLWLQRSGKWNSKWDIYH